MGDVLASMGPDSDWYSLDPVGPEVKAYRSMLRRVLKHHNGHLVNYDKTTLEEKAFALRSGKPFCRYWN